MLSRVDAESDRMRLSRVTCEDVSLFDPDLVDFFWQYQNAGLRLAQLRFYAD